MQPLSKAEQTEKRRRIERKVLFWWALIFSILIGLAFMGLQRSRHESCVANYESFNKVFKPFKPNLASLDRQIEKATVEGKKKLAASLTKRRNDWIRFSHTVTTLKASCDEQVDLIP